MADIWMLYSTFPSRDEALSAARALVEANEAACANVLEPVTSVYRWEGKLEEAQEAVLIAKTARQKVEAATQTIKKLHSYDVPCIVSWPLAQGFSPFLEWVAGEVKKG